jgi:hypothetical protein
MQLEENHSGGSRGASCGGPNDCDGFPVVFAAVLRLDAGRATVTLAGELNQAAALDADELLRQAGLSAALVILDLRGVLSIDTAGLRTVIAADARTCAPCRCSSSTGSPAVSLPRLHRSCSAAECGSGGPGACSPGRTFSCS